jgi:hypothetical protein
MRLFLAQTMRLALVVLSASILVGCLTSEQIAARQEAKQDATCRSYGVVPGTPEYVDCRLRLNQVQAQNDATTTSNLGRRLGNVPNCTNLPPAQAFGCGANGAR